jgi:release factor glutamine methyltransferase
MKYDPAIDIRECPEVYPPLEDTFLLLECVQVRKDEAVLEMGCGTGLITTHCAAAGAMVTAADINPRAVECTRKNLDRNGLKATVVQSDRFSNITGSFDLILFNPPYLAVDEKGTLEAAWAGGEDGVRVLGRFLIEAPAHLKAGGRLLVLLSSEMDHDALYRALATFRHRKVASKRFFFEELSVLELCPVGREEI